MAKTVEIKLDEPIVGHGGDIRVVMVREPRAGDVLDLGDPVIIGSTDSQTLVTVENDEKIKAYIERLVFNADGNRINMDILAQASIVDMLRIREVVLSFFSRARHRASTLRSG